MLAQIHVVRSDMRKRVDRKERKAYSMKGKNEGLVKQDQTWLPWLHIYVCALVSEFIITVAEAHIFYQVYACDNMAIIPGYM